MQLGASKTASQVATVKNATTERMSLVTDRLLRWPQPQVLGAMRA